MTSSPGSKCARCSRSVGSGASTAMSLRNGISNTQSIRMRRFRSSPGMASRLVSRETIQAGAPPKVTAGTAERAAAHIVRFEQALAWPERTGLVALGRSPGVITSRIAQGNQISRRDEAALLALFLHRGHPDVLMSLETKIIFDLEWPMQALAGHCDGRQFERRIDH